MIQNGQSLATHFGNGLMQASDLAASLSGAVVKDPNQDQTAWLEYLETVVRERDGWKDLYQACKDLNDHG